MDLHVGAPIVGTVRQQTAGLVWGKFSPAELDFVRAAGTPAMVDITAPVRPLFGRAHAITWYWSIVFNAAIYACIGVTVELIRLTVRTGAARLRH